MSAPFALDTERLGPLPMVNHIIERLGVEPLFERFVPTADRRVKLPYAKGLGVLLRSLIVEREPIYRQHETVASFAADAFGLTEAQAGNVRDDAVGRALDRLFDADRAALLTEVVVSAHRQFGVSLDQLHNDTTSVRFTGRHKAATGRLLRGKRAPFITYGHSKDHRPDLKQLVLVMTASRDGGVPVQFRCEAGNSSDARTHEQTWDALVRLAGRTDFLYVADSKLCNRDAMDHIDRQHGRFVCVMPRSRLEDKEFRQWLQSNDPPWELVRNRPHPRRKGGPRDRWWTYRAQLPSREGWPVVGLKSNLLALQQERTRRERIARAQQRLSALADKLAGPRPRSRTRAELSRTVDGIIRSCKVSRYVSVKLDKAQRHTFRQAGPGRPGPKTTYVRKTRSYWTLDVTVDEEAIAYDRVSDGMYPLLTNDKSLADQQVFEAHKAQPLVERCFRQSKSVLEIAPVLLKNEGRIEALFFVYFVALLVQALMERQVRKSMKDRSINELPLYPEERVNRRPTAEQILKLFSLAQRSTLTREGRVVQVFQPQLTELQISVLDLMGVPLAAYA